MTPSASPDPINTARQIPGPRGLPFLGQALRYQRDPFGFFLWMRENYGDIVSDPNSGFRMAHVFSPEAIEHVLVRNARNYHKDRIIKSWDLVFGEGLLLTEGEKWKQDRRVINPAFSRARVAEYEAGMLRQAQVCATELSTAFEGGRADAFEGGKVEMMRAMTEVTLRIALESLFGRSSLRELDESALREVQDALHDVAGWFEFSSGAWMALTMLLPGLPYPQKLRYQSAVRRLDEILDRIITRKRRELVEGKVEGADLLAALIQAADPENTSGGSVFTNRQVRDHALTFFLAGHETTSLALTYTLRLLAEHPRIQESLRAELQAAPSGNAGLSALERCELLSQVVDESLRLFPPAAVTAREAMGDDVIHGYRIEAGTTVVIPTWAIHRDSRFYGKDVDAFRPSRWTPEFRKALPRSVYLPFGFGPRMCIGFGFAIQEMKLILAELLRRHRFILPKDAAPLRLQPSITMRPRDPVWLEVTPAN